MTRTLPVDVLIPARDEEDALPGVIGAMPDVVRRVVVVDNGSKDGTAAAARASGAHVVRENRPGYGGACLAGLAWMERQPDPPGIVVFVDADHGEGPEQIPRLIAPILEGDADLVLGVRRAADGSMPVHARLGNRLVLGLVHVLFGRGFRDLPPFRAVRFDALRRLRMDDEDWGWTLQMQIRAVRAGFRIHEMEIVHGPRRHGRSKISRTFLGSVRAGRTMFRTLARERVRPKHS